MPTTGLGKINLKVPTVEARNVFSQSIHYALEIFTDTNISNSTYGISAGTFRFVTDRPNYSWPTGITAKYGPDEIGKDGNPVGGNDVAHKFYEGFLLKDWLTSNPVRAIDITITGAYSTDSKFSFKIRNDQKFWDFCQTNNINLTGCRVVLWVSIDNIFYQLSRGRVVNNPYTETEYTWNVDDDAVLIHKNLPPRLSVLPSDSSTLSTVNQGDPIPVVFGNVAYSKALNLKEETVYQDLCCEFGAYGDIVLHDVTGAYKYELTMSDVGTVEGGTKQATAYLYLVTDYLTNGLTIAAHALAGKYLGVVSGEGADLNAIYKILDNDATVVDSDADYWHTTKVQLTTPLVDSSGEMVTTASFGHKDITKPSYKTLSGSQNSSSKTWWFKVSDFSQTVRISNFQVFSASNIYTYDSSSNKYIDVSSVIVNTVSGATNVLTINANSSTKNGEITLLENIDVTNMKLVEYGLCGEDGAVLESYVSDSDILQITDKDRTTPKVFTTPISDDKSRYLWFKYNVSGMILNKSYDKIMLLVDFNTIGQVYKPVLGVFRYDNYNMFNVYHVDDIFTVRDYARIADFSNTGTIYSKSFAISGDWVVHLIPDEYYPVAKQGMTGYCLLNLLADTTTISFKQMMSIDSAKLAQVGSIILNLFYGIRQTVTPDTYYLRLKQMALLGQITIGTIFGDLFIKVSGETVGNSGSVQTNNLYTTFRHILEDYDGIPSKLIDYGNLATRRNDWYTARTITEQKNSVEYLGELCAHGFVGMFTGRTGKRVLRDIMTDGVSLTPTLGEGKTPTHNKSLILRDSISSFKKTDGSQIYNSFRMQYQYDQGSQKFTRSFSVANVDQTSFPTSGTADPNDSTIPKWWSYFSGLPVSASDWTLNYTASKTIWDVCNASYLLNKVVRTTQNDLAELPWFVDTTVFTATDTTGTGVTCSAYKLLKLLSSWTTVQKDIVSYSIPLTAETYGTELLDLVYFNDFIYTKGVNRLGFVVSNEVDYSGNQLNLQVMLWP